MLSNLGTRIKEERTKRGWSQNELGKRVGCSGVAIMRYEKDSSDKAHREPSLERIEAIAEAFGITSFQLMGAEYFDKKKPGIGKEVLLSEQVERVFGKGAAELLDAFSKLNEKGKTKVVNYTTDLCEIDIYLNKQK